MKDFIKWLFPSMLLAVCCSTHAYAQVVQEGERLAAPNVVYSQEIIQAIEEAVSKKALKTFANIETLNSGIQPLSAIDDDDDDQLFCILARPIDQRFSYRALKHLYTMAESQGPGGGLAVLARIYQSVKTKSLEADPAFAEIRELDPASVNKSIKLSSKPVTGPVGPEGIIRKLAEALPADSAKASRVLSRLGFADAVKAIVTMDGIAHTGTLSLEGTLREFYWRAESTEKGEGMRFLKILSHDAAKNSIGIQKDPDFRMLLRATPGELQRPMDIKKGRFVGTPKRLSPTLERAIGRLGEIYAGPQIAKMRVMLLRNLNPEKFSNNTYENVFRNSTTATELIERSLVRGTPPPSKTEALLGIFKEAQASSAAIEFDPETLSIMKELSKELPNDRRKLASQEAKLKSKQRQDIQIAKNIQRKNPRNGFGGDKPNDSGPSSGGGGGGGVGPSRPKNTPGGSGGPKNSGGRVANRNAGLGGTGGGGTGASTRTGRYGRYIKSSFSKGTQRVHYRRAIRSSGSRGISIGGAIDHSGLPAPLTAYWYPNEKDPQFGRVFIKTEIDGVSNLIASKIMYADSFRSAIGVLCNEHDDNEVLRKDRLLILVSMDPGANWTGRPPQQSALVSMVDSLTRPNMIPFKLAGVAFDSWLYGGVRGVVSHPGIHNSELAWSATRVDFWLSDLKLLIAEANECVEDKASFAKFEDFNFGGAATWQFFELDKLLTLEKIDAKTSRLVVQSTWKKTDKHVGTHFDKGTKDSHFGSTMFTQQLAMPGIELIKDEDLLRIPRIEKRIQPLLDSLAQSHPDFVRLNDFSESLAILRWLGEKKGTIHVVDFGGETLPPTPNVIKIGTGPRIR